jgi:hypothetical protein
MCTHCFLRFPEPPADDGGAEITKYIVELDDGQGKFPLKLGFVLFLFYLFFLFRV